MGNEVHDKPSEVAAQDGIVAVDGPDGVAVRMTPGAASETSERLLRGAIEAQGQQVKKRVRDGEAV
jgi:hypothetical protein